MKKVLIIFILLSGLLVGVYYFIKNYYHLDPKFLVKLSKPPPEDIARHLPQGSDLNFPLNLPEGYSLAVFADLGEVGMPRVLAFDDRGVLFASIPKAGKIVALPDRNNDGIADEVMEILTNLARPHGIAFHGEKIYVAETSRVIRYDYHPENLRVDNRTILFSLPPGGRHFTRTIKILEDKLYTSVGSSCDTCIEADERRAAILISELDGSNLRVFAKGLRNTVFFVFDEQGRLWGNDMGRDFLGDDLPPDELNMVEAGGDYGWPYCYGDKVRDSKFKPGKESDYCDNTKPTTFDYPAHVSPLGLVFVDSDLFPSEDNGGLLVSLHGSWNRTVPVGYKIVKLEVAEDKVLRSEDFITGWLKENGDVLGRPVDLVFGPDGVLYISDDKAGLIYILTK